MLNIQVFLKGMKKNILEAVENPKSLKGAKPCPDPEFALP
jgi:hypothetical protein